MPSFVAASSIVAVEAKMRRMCSASVWSSVSGSPSVDGPVGPCRWIADLRWQVCQLDDGAGGENDAAFDGVAQLADVSRPGIARKASRTGSANPEIALAFCWAKNRSR